MIHASEADIVLLIRSLINALQPYELFVEDMIAEGNKVVIRARVKGKHEGSFKGIPPTYKEVNVPGVICYEIENDKIVHHWMIADQLALMEQLGLIGVPQE